MIVMIVVSLSTFSIVGRERGGGGGEISLEPKINRDIIVVSSYAPVCGNKL